MAASVEIKIIKIIRSSEFTVDMRSASESYEEMITEATTRGIL